MATLSPEFLDRLLVAPIARSVVVAELGTKQSVSLALSRYAREMTPPRVVERHGSGSSMKYGLRPAVPGESPGQLTQAR